MQWTYVVDLQGTCLLQDSLYLRTILADDVGIVASCLIDPVVHEVNLISEDAAVQCAECTKGISRKEDLVGLVI